MYIFTQNIRTSNLYFLNRLLHLKQRKKCKNLLVPLYISEENKWQTVTRTSNGPLQDFTISYQTLLPSTSYNFRVIPYNRFGVSCPAYSDEAVFTPSKLYLEYDFLQHKPFYRQTWFMVALAATSIIIVIMVIAVLCVKSKSYKYKRKFFTFNRKYELYGWLCLM